MSILPGVTQKTAQLLVFQVSSGREFKAILRFDTEVELNYFQHGGILNYMIRKMV